MLIYLPYPIAPGTLVCSYRWWMFPDYDATIVFSLDNVRTQIKSMKWHYCNLLLCRNTRFVLPLDFNFVLNRYVLISRETNETFVTISFAKPRFAVATIRCERKMQHFRGGYSESVLSRRSFFSFRLSSLLYTKLCPLGWLFSASYFKLAYQARHFMPSSLNFSSERGTIYTYHISPRLTPVE